MTRFAHHIAIVGGGISGLSTALAIQEESAKSGCRVECTLVERAPWLGGKICTHHVDGLIVEAGPDSFLTSKPWTLELCEKLGLTSQLINTNVSNSQTFCFTKGRLHELPQGLVAFVPTRLGALLTGGLISPLGMLRMGWEWFVPRRRDADHDESLASFFRRRVGHEAFDHFIEPLVAGIYAGDADDLSLRATFPRFYELEQQYGSLIRGMRAQQARTPPASKNTGVKRTMFATLRGGLGDLVDALVKQVSSNGGKLCTGRHVLEMSKPQPSSPRYTLVLDNEEKLCVDSVVLATPAYTTAKLLKASDSELAGLLEQIPYCSTATVSLAYQDHDIQGRLKGFGFVVPRVEGRYLIAATWTSLKWPYRSKPGQTLIRCYVGGKGREKILEETDTNLLKYVRQQLQDIVGIACEPVFTEIHRWDHAMPQYVCGHLRRLQQIRALMEGRKGLYLTGAAFEGLGIPDCIRQGTHVGKELVKALSLN